MSDDVTFVKHVACPDQDCGSSDGAALYSDGHVHCFVCETTVQSGEAPPPGGSPKAARGLETPGEFVYLTARKIPAEVCRKFGYTVNGGAQIAPYHDADGKVVAQKIRRAGKQFSVAGDISSAGLFGQHLWRSTGGKRITVVEGEIDAMATFHMNGGWPVVSVPNGAGGAKKAVAKQIEFLESFDTVVFCFDNDEPGKAASVECAEILSPGKAKIATLPLKDAGEMLVAGRVKEFMSAIYEAKDYRPDGIINLADTWDLVSEEVVMGAPYPAGWDALNEILYGLRGGEIVTLCAGSGVGKSAVSAEIAYHLAQELKHTVGYVALEEGIRRTAMRFMGMYLNLPIHLPGHTLAPEVRRDAFDQTLGTGRLFSYDHFGSLDGDNLLAKLRYLVVACGVRWIILDHISIVVSGMDADSDERKAIDRLMTRLRSFAEETGVGLILVSHLKRPDGRSHEEGGRVSLAQLRGSGAIAQLSDVVIGVERDQQSDDPVERNTTTLRVLKNRYSGITGVGGYLLYCKDTGRLVATSAPPGDDDSSF